jgi:hypothetical protein
MDQEKRRNVAVFQSDHAVAWIQYKLALVLALQSPNDLAEHASSTSWSRDCIVEYHIHSGAVNRSRNRAPDGQVLGASYSVYTPEAGRDSRIPSRVNPRT